MFAKGVTVETLLDNVQIDSLYRQDETISYSVFDEIFDDSSSYISGAPSIHYTFEKAGDELTILVYLDLKSMTYSFSSKMTEEVNIPGDFKKMIEDYVLEKSKVASVMSSGIDDIIGEIRYFTGYSIHVLGFASTSRERFEELERETEDLECSFSSEVTQKTRYNAMLINLIARESKIYEGYSQQYLVPNVGMEGMELSLGTNPRFFLNIVEDSDDDSIKTSKKYLYNIMFERISKYLTERFEVSHYSTSKVEKAFIIEGLSIERIELFLEKVSQINKMAPGLFKESITQYCEKLGYYINNAEKKVKQLGNFYDENSIVGFVTHAYTDEDELHRQLLEVLLDDTIPTLIAIVKKTVAFIDQYLEKKLA